MLAQYSAIKLKPTRARCDDGHSIAGRNAENNTTGRNLKFRVSSARARSNSTVLTVTPQSTQAIVPTESPDQIQQNATNSGWLTIYNEWSWWYPWYRLYFAGNGIAKL